MRKELVTAAEKVFEIGIIYDWQSVKEKFEAVEIYIHNVAAYTYNRWNKGMTEICELFEHVDKGRYKYLGSKEVSNYTGCVFHYPQGKNKIYKIGNWENGVFKFINSNIQSFAEWKCSDFDGIQSVDIDSVVTFVSLDGNNNQTRVITNDPENKGKSNGDYMYLLYNSNLGEILLNKCLGDTFNFGTIEYKIIKID